MCGLWGGYSTSLVDAEIDNVKELAIVSQLRGFDSTGAVTIAHGQRNKLRTLSHRVVGHSSDFLTNKDAQQLFIKPNPFLIAGHSRAATIGAVNERNAHPIAHRHIIGTHNGTINAFRPATKEEEQVTSDSRVLFQKIAEEGSAKAFLDARQGAWAVVWVNLQERTLNFARNNQRPLYYVWSKAGSLYWASERRILEFMIEGSWAQWNKVEMFDTEVHYKITFGTTNMRRELIDLPFQTVPSIFPKPDTTTPKVTVHTSLEIPPWHEVQTALDEKWCKSCQKEVEYCYCAPEKTTTRTAIGEQLSKHRYKGFMGVEISPILAHHRLKDGCTNCRRISKLKDKVYWYSTTHHLCEDCGEDRVVLDMMPPGTRSYPNIGGPEDVSCG